MIHISDPDHTINQRLHKLYPEEIAQRSVNDIIDLIYKYKQRIESKEYHISEKDVILISYGDQVHCDHEPSLKTLNEFMNKYVS